MLTYLTKGSSPSAGPQPPSRIISGMTREVVLMHRPEIERQIDAQMITATSMLEAIDFAKNGSQCMVKCPAHDDGTESLHVSPGTKQPVVMKCMADCHTADILTAANIDQQMLMAPRDENNYGLNLNSEETWSPVKDEAGRPIPPSHVYKYTDATGENVLFEVLRIPKPGGKKTFMQRQPDPEKPGKWKWNMNGVTRVLYHLPEVLRAVNNGETIYLVEGEKDVETLRRRGVTATTAPMGAGISKWMPEYTEALAASNVIIIADADTPGREHARGVKELLDEAGCVVSINEAMNGCKDVTDHFNAGGTLDNLIETVPAIVEGRESYGMDILDAIEREIKPASFVIPGVLAQGDRWLLTGFEGHGKAVALDTPIATPDGWTTMGEIQVGQRLYTGGGKITRVAAKSEVMTDKDCWEVEFDDGTVATAAGDHLWETETLASREASARLRRRGEETKLRGTDQRHKRLHKPQTVTTRHIAATLRTEDGVANHSIPVCGELEGVSAPLPIDPYTLGAWLGDGTSAEACITTHPNDEEILENIRAAGWQVTKTSAQYRWSITGERRWASSSFKQALRDAGVLDNKHIPDVYLYADAASRLALVQGLMDTDGSVTSAGQGEFCSTSERLALGMSWLLRSLGIKIRHITSDATLNGVVIGPKYRLIFVTDLPVFRLARKAARVTSRPTARQKLRYITDVRPVEPVPVQCLQVEDEEHTYLITHALIPTHNSTFCRQLAIQVAAGIHPWTGNDMPPQKVMVVDSENHPDQVLESWQDMIGRAVRLGRPIERGMLILQEEWDNEINLNEPTGKRWLLERIQAHKPALVVIGPLYNLANKDLSEHTVVNEMKSAINEARGICGTAFIMEHHAPHRGNGDKDRSVRPYGSSTFLKWPDFGYGLKPEEDEGYYELQKTRFPRVRSRHFPGWMRWGKENTLEWPWESVSDAEADMMGFGKKKF